MIDGQLMDDTREAAAKGKHTLAPERESITGVIRPSDKELVERAVRNARRPGYQKWAGVMDVFAVGSTSAQALCREFGLDPDAVTPRPLEDSEE